MGPKQHADVIKILGHGAQTTCRCRSYFTIISLKHAVMLKNKHFFEENLCHKI